MHRSQLLALPRGEEPGVATGAKDSLAEWLLQHQHYDAVEQAGFLSSRREPKLLPTGPDAFLPGVSRRRS
jgi:hypothetical protein